MSKNEFLFIGHSEIVHKEFNFFLKKNLNNYTRIYFFDYVKKNGYLNFCQTVENKIKNGTRKIIIDANRGINILWLKNLKLNYGLKIILFSFDDEYQFYDNTIFFSKISDFVFSTDVRSVKKLNKIGIKSSFFCEPVKNRKNIIKKQKYDVSFVGVLNKPGRKEYISFLKKKKIKVKIFDSSKGRIPLKKMYKIYNETKINLNFSRISNYENSVVKNTNKKGFKGRVGEIFSCNSFCLSEGSFQLKKIFFFATSIFFENKKQLLDKINFFLKNEKFREKIIKKTNFFIVNNYSSKSLRKKIFYIFKNCSSSKNMSKLKNEKLINEQLHANFVLLNINFAFKLFFKKPFLAILDIYHIFLLAMIIPFKIKYFDVSIYLNWIIKKIILKLRNNIK